jgi:hypothetical protein
MSLYIRSYERSASIGVTVVATFGRRTRSRACSAAADARRSESSRSRTTASLTRPARPISRPTVSVDAHITAKFASACMVPSLLDTMKYSGESTCATYRTRMPPARRSVPCGGRS